MNAGDFSAARRTLEREGASAHPDLALRPGSPQAATGGRGDDIDWPGPINNSRKGFVGGAAEPFIGRLEGSAPSRR